ncbi:MAG: energy-coupling factor transporter transmembrane component T, partial [Lachnospiraceae bacterium]|nr:energy-coupling factor transporter transmembrane component T [Lachnospiraceae bacterium]
TTIEKICYALHLLHVPGILITQFLLTYRYVTVLLKEVNRITQAYSLRAPNQKGIHYKVWGSLTGQVLLRSMDRANAVYESMMLRGYDGSFAYMGKDIRISVSDVIYLLLWLAVFVIFRKYPVFLIVGGIF